MFIIIMIIISSSNSNSKHLLNMVSVGVVDATDLETDVRSSFRDKRVAL